MKIGVLAISGKPVHAGHYGLIELAARECDEVRLFVSLSDRARPGEVPILGSDMSRIWKEYIEPTLPINVQVTYGGSPVRNTWDLLGKANAAESTDEYILYGDPDDVTGNFPDTQLSKYAKNLFDRGLISRRPVKRSSTTDISGTDMRSYIAVGDRTSFVKNMPSKVNGNAIFDILSATAESKPHVKTTSKAKNVKKPAG